MSGIPEPELAVPRGLPSGTVTFVFTDIEGSTQRWERDRAAMQDAVRRHDAILRAQLTAHGGYVFKTIGDAFCAAFARAPDAIAALVSVQRVLAAEDFRAVDGVRVRAAAHAGTADERDGDYFGPTVNRVARLLAVAHGGQTIVSAAVHDLAHGALDAAVTWIDLGHHRLKDLALPEHVYGVHADGLPADFPPLRSLEAVRHNLPGALTSFIGRAGDVDAVTALLAAHRCVTITGEGGVGKTRVSLQAAANLVDSAPGGVWFVELGPLSSGDYIVANVAHAAGIRLPAHGDPVAQLATAFADAAVLLVFDNCEHLAEAAGRVIAALLRACPNLRVLASSRQRLRVMGETVFRLPPLELPAPDGGRNTNEVGRSAACALFAERAGADGRFVLDDGNAGIVAEICRRLDGLPLAIELAAARVRILSPRQLRERLDERFRLLTGGRRDAAQRQQTLRALIDWSHDLLAERERIVFRRLGIFVNGFTLEAAAAVGDIDQLDAVDIVASLTDQSLLVADAAGDVMRYRMLESTRLYAREKLAGAGERDACAARRTRHLAERAAEARRSDEDTARRSAVPALLVTELAEIRAAWDDAAAGHEPVAAAAIFADVGLQLERLDVAREGLHRGAAFVERIGDGDLTLRARIERVIAALSANAGNAGFAFEAASRSVTHARAAGDPPALAGALRDFAENAIRVHRLDDAEAALAEAEAMHGISAGLRIMLLSSRAYLGHQRGDLGMARNAYTAARAQHRALGNAHAEVLMAVHLADVEFTSGDTAAAIAHIEDILPWTRAYGSRDFLCGVLGNLAAYYNAAGNLAGARAAAADVLRDSGGRSPDGIFSALAIEHAALTFALSGDPVRAATLAGYAEAACRRHGYERDGTESAMRTRLSAVLAARLTADEREQHAAAGERLRPSAAVALAMDTACES